MKKRKWEADALLLDQISFFGLKGILCGTALSVYLSGELTYRLNLWQFIRQCFRELLVDNYTYQFKSDSKILFYFSYEYAGRKDYRDWWDKVADLIPWQFKVTPGKTRNFSIRTIPYILYLFVWSFQLRIAGQKCTVRFAELIFLLRAKIALDNLIRKIKSKNVSVNLFVSLCDVFPTDSILVQYFNSIGTDTATLQHGFYSPNAKENLVFTKSRSKFFLTWGEMTNRAAVTCGVKPEKLVAAGPPHFIHCPVIEIKKKKEIRTIGVFLNKSEGKEENKAIINIVNKLCLHNHLHYYVRIHPSTEKKEIESCICKDVFLGYLPNTESVYNSLDQFEAAITGSTTMFAELLFYRKPAFRYIGNQIDIYGTPDLEWCRFDTIEEVESLIQYTIKNDDIAEQMEKTCEMLFDTGDIGENYRRFFSKYL